MSLSAQQIEQVVIRVMEQLLTPTGRRGSQLPLSPWERAGVRGGPPEESGHSPHPNPLPEGEGTAAGVFLPQMVITQELLSAIVNSATCLRIAPRAIITPSAR